MSDVCCMNGDAHLIMSTCRYCGEPADGAWHAGCDAEHARRCKNSLCTYCGDAATDNGMYCDSCRGAARPEYVGYPEAG